MPTARISTTEMLDLQLDVAKLAEQVGVIEHVYHISVARFAGEYHEEHTQAIFHGLEENIREFIQDEEGVTAEEAEKFIAETVEAEVPFWNVGVMADYLSARGWKKRVAASNKIALRGDGAKLTFTKFASPNRAVVVEVPVFSPDPEEVTVYILDNEESDFTPGEQFLKASPLHRIDLGAVVATAEKFLSAK